MKPIKSLGVFAITAILLSCTPNPYALNDDQIKEVYTQFSARQSKKYDTQRAKFNQIAKDIKNNLALAFDGKWNAGKVVLDDDIIGSTEKIEGEFFTIKNPKFNFICLPYSALQGEYDEWTYKALFDEYSLGQFEKGKKDGYELSSGPPYFPQGRTANFYRDTLSQMQLMEAKYIGVFYPISQKIGSKVGLSHFSAGSAVGAAYLYDLEKMKVLDGFLFQATNSNEVKYNMAWGDGAETIKQVLEKDLKGHIVGEFYRGFEKHCTFEY